MKKYITMIFCLIALGTIAAEYNTQQDIDKVVNAWATKWNITSNIEARFERLTGANPTDVKTFNNKFGKYVKDFFSNKKEARSTRKANKTASRVFTPRPSQFIIRCNFEMDNKEVCLSNGGEITIIESRFIHKDLIALHLFEDTEYTLCVEGIDSFTFMIHGTKIITIEKEIEVIAAVLQ